MAKRPRPLLRFQIELQQGGRTGAIVVDLKALEFVPARVLVFFEATEGKFLEELVGVVGAISLDDERRDVLLLNPAYDPSIAGRRGMGIHALQHVTRFAAAHVAFQQALFGPMIKFEAQIREPEIRTK